MLIISFHDTKFKGKGLMKEWFKIIVSRKSYAQELLEYLFHNKLCDEHYYDYFCQFDLFLCKLYSQSLH